MSNKKEAYLCVSAMLRAREPKLLNLEKAGRMLDAASVEDAAKLLTDCGYPDMSQMSASEVEETLAQRRGEIFKEMQDLSPDKELVDLFKLKYDYHNAKAILKAEAVGTDCKHLLSDAGRLPGKQLLELYNEEKYSRMPEKLAAAMAEAKAVLARTSNPQLADFVLDKAYFAEIRDAADKEGLASLFAHTKLEKAAALGAEALAGGGMTAFEKACDNAVNSYLQGAKLISYGPEAVAAYVAAVEGEIQAVRMILTGRLAGVRPEAIRERLRDLYA